MTDFDQALALVHDTLLRVKENPNGLAPSASAESVRRLVEAAQSFRPAKTQPSTTAPSAAALETPGHQPITGLAARARAMMESAAPKPAPAPEPKPRPAFIPPPPPAAPSAPGGSKTERMEALRQQTSVCIKCPHLAASRTQVVFGVGNPNAELMFVGEAPGADEDLQGEPFVGKAGQLLTKIIEAMGFQRSDVYIANILKCRPDMPPQTSGNRKPRPEEMATCLPYLLEQIDIIQPKCLVALGATAMEGLLGSKSAPVGGMRGHWQSFHGIPLMPTYHPAYLLRNQSLSEKRKVWEDMLMVLHRLGQPISAKQQGYFLPK